MFSRSHFAVLTASFVGLLLFAVQLTQIQRDRHRPTNVKAVPQIGRPPQIGGPNPQVASPYLVPAIPTPNHPVITGMRIAERDRDSEHAPNPILPQTRPSMSASIPTHWDRNDWDPAAGTVDSKPRPTPHDAGRNSGQASANPAKPRSVAARQVSLEQLLGPSAYHPPRDYLSQSPPVVYQAQASPLSSASRHPRDPVSEEEDLLWPEYRSGSPEPTQAAPQPVPSSIAPRPVPSNPLQQPQRPGVQSDDRYDRERPPQPDEDLLEGLVPDVRQPVPPRDVPPPEKLPSREELPSPTPKDTAVEVVPVPGTISSEPPTRKRVPPPRRGGQAPALEPPAAEEAKDPHLDVFAEGPFPSAKACRVCHEQIYDEWASSSHAYAAISPMFQRFEQTISDISQGTVGYFCWRCHTPVGTTLQLPRYAAIYDSVPAAREGVTCVVCHRVIENYGKVNAERRIEPGDIFDPMVGSGHGEGLEEVLAHKEKYKVKTDLQDKSPGQAIHNRVIHFEQLSSSQFCVSCHQVAVYPGIALEVVWQQYRASPAHAQGISCQECHMGQEPGLAAGYTYGPVAVVNEKPISPERKHSNHLFYGPGYSIAHPGVFPMHPKADQWKVPEWLEFDWRAGWGTEAFEKQVDDGQRQAQFPKVWSDQEDRIAARKIINQNLHKLLAKKQMRRQLMENSSRIEGPVFARTPRVRAPLEFTYQVHSLNMGHNMPSGSLGAQPQLWLNVVLTGPGGEWLWESGYVDANGDVADVHSLEVAKGRIARDLQLVNFQTKFLITHVKGTDREFYLPINVDIDQLPFIRPSGFPITVMNHPPQIRMEAHSLPPLGMRTAHFRVPRTLITQPGNYQLAVRMRSRAEPMYFMRFCGATPEMERSMNEWMLDYHEQSFVFSVAP